MHLEHKHNVGQADAIRKIDAGLDDLLARPLPGGVAVTEVSRDWSDHTLHCSFRAKKGVFGTVIAAVIRVHDHSVEMDCDLPGLVTTFVAEDKIQEVIHRQLDGLFPA